MAAAGVTQEWYEGSALKKSHTPSINSSKEKPEVEDAEVAIKGDEEDGSQPSVIYAKMRPYLLTGLALVILGWWISATIMHATRHRWYVHVSLIVKCTLDSIFSPRIVQTLFAWAFIL
jgi:CNT family concentrative nucleoside transporter